jgi:hypothetical protein
MECAMHPLNHHWFQQEAKSLGTRAVITVQRARTTIAIALLLALAVLFLAIGAAHAEEKFDDSWWTDCRHG